jgi:hypothetical protein
LNLFAQVLSGSQIGRIYGNEHSTMPSLLQVRLQTAFPCLYHSVTQWFCLPYNAQGFIEEQRISTHALEFSICLLFSGSDDALVMCWMGELREWLQAVRIYTLYIKNSVF